MKGGNGPDSASKLRGSAVAVHRRGHRDSCLEAQADPGDSNAFSQTTVTMSLLSRTQHAGRHRPSSPTSWLTSLCSWKQVLAVQVQQRTVETPQVQVPSTDRVMTTPGVQPTAASVSLVTQRQMPAVEKILMFVEIPQAQGSAVKQRQMQTNQNIQKIVELLQLHFRDKVVDVQLCCNDKWL